MKRIVVALPMLLLVRVSVAQPATPNIVLILTDDQGWTSTSVQLDPANPESRSDFFVTVRLNELASQGMRFSNAYSSGPMCSPTRASIQSGKSTAQLQMTDLLAGGDPTSQYFGNSYVGEPLSAPMPRRRLPLAEITIAERIKASRPEYATAHFGKWHLGDDPNMDLQGYDEFGWGPPVAGEDPKFIDRYTSRANTFLEDKAAAGQPFFLQISHFAVHAPIEARAATIKRYMGMPGGERHDSSDAEFAAMVHDLDAGIGVTLDKLVELGLDSNTYVFVVSDNGGLENRGFGNNLPLVNEKGSLNEGGIRVPMIVRGPGIEANSHCAIPVVTHDLFTTITALVGVTTALPEGVEGGDLSPVLFNGGVLPDGVGAIERGQGSNGELFFHYPHYLNGGSSLFWGQQPTSAIRDGDFKLIKRYGSGGNPDQLFLFNLAQTLEESPDPDSLLNLADSLPATAAVLSAKLDSWLDAVDASQAYEVSEAIELTWDAGSIGAASGGWRSVEDVDYLFREQWDLIAGAEPALVPSNTPPGLSDQAYRFDGNDRMIRKFFHVSDITDPDTFDNDHSASFEFWLKTDALIQEQVLFESGDGNAGLSITFGDGDADGQHDEVRFRIRGEGPATELTLTSTLPPAITQSFVQLVAVISDDPADRYAELFSNGQLLGCIDGIPGVDEIDWDLVDPASLGSAAGFGVGGNGGPGDLPFAGGGFTGEIALFRFNNYAVGGIEVLNRFNEITSACPWDCADGDDMVGIADLLAALSQWGVADACDFDGGGVGITDLLTLLGNWGPCP